MTLWLVLWWLMAAVAIPLFIVQFLCWLGLRLRRISVQKFRRLARTWLVVGLALLVTGGLLWSFGPPAALKAALVGVLGGTLNALNAALHLWIVDVLTRKPPTK